MLRRLALVSTLLLAALALCDRPAPRVLGTFNIRMFPHEHTDLEAVARAIAELDADAFAVQEIVSPAAFARVLERASALTGRRYAVALEMSHCPRRGTNTHAGVVHDLEVFERLESRMLGEFTCPKGQPAGMVALLRARDGRRLALASLHLSSGGGESMRAERMAQWAWLIDALPDLRAELDAPVVLAGDFNSTGYLVEGDPERVYSDTLVARHGLQLPTASLACSMYWRPPRRDFEVSLLDHIVAPAGLSFGPAEALGMCAELACAPQTGAPATWRSVSDHCPVRVQWRP